jgi:cell wall-associated NlpC family hydrolase
MITREEAVEVAKSWLGTPYMVRGAIKGECIDCATLLLEYLHEIGATEDIDVPMYKADWFHHTTDNRYLVQMSKRAILIAETICRGTIAAKPGDILLFSHQKKLTVYTHGAIVIQWPKVMHAVSPKVTLADATQDVLMGLKRVAILSPWKEETDV